MRGFGAKMRINRKFSFPAFWIFRGCAILGEKEEEAMKKTTRCLAVLLLFAALISWVIPGVTRADDQSLRLLCLNIGKGDCMLLFWEDQAYLIDAGYAQTYAALETALEEYGVSRLNGVFLTHCHKDHSGGLWPLAQSDLAIDAWYAAAIYFDVKENEHPAQLAAAQRGETVHWLQAGDVIPAGETGSFTVLGPLSVHEENENNNSLVMRFACPQGSILLAGDMKEDEEADLAAAGAFSPCDVLKVGHHGDNKATDMPLLRTVRPKAAVILTSTQEEPDTPARSTLDRLASVNCAVYVSQDARDALLVTVKNGSPGVEDVTWRDVPERAEGISLTMDLENDLLTIRNDSARTVSLAGCALYSSRGDDSLPLPDAALAPGQAVTVGSRVSPAGYDIFWDAKRVWHQKKRDMAVLYDAYGRALARTDNGIAE